MHRNLLVLVFIILLAAPWAHAQAQWFVETQMTTSMYHDVDPVDFSPISLTERQLELALGLMWDISDNGHFQLSFPMQTTCQTLISGPGKLREADIGLSLPRMSLEVSGSTILGPDGFCRLMFNPSGPLFHSELGLEWVWDPLLAYASLALTGQHPALRGGIMFAANKRWALGAHLVYRGFAEQNPVSALSYQVYYQSPRGKACEVILTHHLGTPQHSLGWKLLF